MPVLISGDNLPKQWNSVGVILISVNFSSMVSQPLVPQFEMLISEVILASRRCLSEMTLLGLEVTHRILVAWGIVYCVRRAWLMKDMSTVAFGASRICVDLVSPESQ